MKVHKIMADCFVDRKGRLRIRSYCCIVCKQVGPKKAMVEIAESGDMVHRWPCRDRVLI